jgi:hypothetical protein
VNDHQNASYVKTMKRMVEAELLDELPADDRRAVHARRDLQKVNAWMGHARIMARVLDGLVGQRSPRTITELGAGDGTLLLRLAKTMAPRWGPMRVVLVDRQPLLSRPTRDAFEALSWSVESVQMDVFDWLARPLAEPSDIILANLFLHHFANDDLRRLLCYAAIQTNLFLACEPRRQRLSMRAVGLLWLIGCNQVATHDARISVRAGFVDTDLSALWPADGRWELFERPAGGFSHCFCAHRIVEDKT